MAAVHGNPTAQNGRRRLLAFAVSLSALVALGVLSLGASTATAQTGVPAPGTPSPTVNAGDVSRDDAIAQLQHVRASIDETLELLKQDRRAEAFESTKSGYLDHFETVEVPLRAADPELTLQAEEKFAEIRADIRADAPTEEVRAHIVELRGLIDDAERALTAEGIGAPTLVFAQAFLIIFREGLEAVLLLSVLLGYLEATKNSQYKKHILAGVGLAVIATVATFIGVNALFAVLPFGREVLEALVSLLAVGVLFYVSFWLIARLEQRRWLEFLKARVWTAVSIGSATSLVLIGFTSVYREGFETALFFQALSSFGKGLEPYIGLGALAGMAALAVVAFLIFRLGRQLPIRAFLSIAVVLIMTTSVAFLGNAVRSLQEADVVGFTRLQSWPRLPIFLAQATGYYPSVQTVVAQALLIAVYVTGAVYMFVIRPRRQRPASPAPSPSSAEPVAAAAPG